MSDQRDPEGQNPSVEPNVDRSPESDLKRNSERYPPALRIQRLAASLIDLVILNIALVPVLFLMGFTEYTQPGEIPYAKLVQFHIWLFVFFAVINGWLLYRYGQTIGKRILKIAIATDSYEVPEFNRMLALRYLPFAIANLVPVLSLVPLVDVLMIFKRDRRCLHDMLARTQVIDVSKAG